MSRRLSPIPPALLLGVCLVVLPACKKKPSPDVGGGGGEPAGPTGPTGPPAAVSSDYLIYAQVNAKSIRDSALFGEVKAAVTKAGGAKEWEESEAKSAEDIGVKWSEVDTATIVVPDAPAKGPPKVIAVITASKAFDKAALLKKGGKSAAPDPSGFYKIDRDQWFHFPDDKTLVIVHPDLAPKYLDGYAKNRSGWPLNADLARAASGHTAFATFNLQKVPRDTLQAVAANEQFSAVAAAQKVTVTANLRGKELSVGVRATYPDAASAGKAKDQAQKLLGFGEQFIGMAASGKELSEMPSLKPAVTEAQRAVKAAKIEVAGSDVTAAASYKADFDLNPIVAEAVKKIRETGERMTISNNLKQIGLALHNYQDTTGRLPIHAVGANGMPLRNATDKPLLSWRVAILPYIEQDNLYKQFKHNEPWDSPANKKLIEQMPKIFAPEKPGKPGYTHLQMIIGPNAMPVSGMTIQQIPDGSSNTIAVAEAADPVIWTKPDDVMLPPKLAPGELKKKFRGQTPGGFNVVMWDGAARFVKDSVSERNLASAINPRDGLALPLDWNER